MPDYESRLAILKATLRNSPISKDVNLSYLASCTDKFSGADLSEICQTACKLAIREDIEHEARIAQEQEEYNAKEDLDEFLPEILPRHFEEAVRTGRRSVSDRDLVQYTTFAESLQGLGGGAHGGEPLRNFRFPRRNERQTDLDEDIDSDDLS